MEGLDLFLSYIDRASFVTHIVIVWLSIYIIITFGLLFSRYFYLSSWLEREKNSLESMLMGSKVVRDDSILKRFTNYGEVDEKLLNVCKSVAQKSATDGLWLLSVIASTSPFIGLFGTVVSILETFGGLGDGEGGASLGVIAPAISEALIVTGAGIFVAIPAYSVHLFLKRKAYEVVSYVDRESDMLLSVAQKERVDG